MSKTNNSWINKFVCRSLPKTCQPKTILMCQGPYLNHPGSTSIFRPRHGSEMQAKIAILSDDSIQPATLPVWVSGSRLHLSGRSSAFHPSRFIIFRNMISARPRTVLAPTSPSHIFCSSSRAAPSPGVGAIVRPCGLLVSLHCFDNHLAARLTTTIDASLDPTI